MQTHLKTKQLFEFDSLYAAKVVAGVDEAGRGPLAGPVVCACCVMPNDAFIDKINDSKALSEKARELLYQMILSSALDYSISEIDNNIIDKINILQATKLGMKNAINGINKVKPDIILVDAVKDLDVAYKCEAIIKGDAKSYSIAAASILAKVYRDRLKIEADKIYPEYGFASNKGYGTATHIEAIKKYGKCDIHRESFIKNFIGI